MDFSRGIWLLAAFAACPLEAAASGVQLTYSQPVASFYQLAAAQLPAGATEDQVRAFLLSHQPTLHQLIAQGYATPTGVLLEADVAEFRARFAAAEAEAALKQRLDADRLLDRVSAFLYDPGVPRPTRWAERQELTALVDAINEHRRHYLLEPQRLQLSQAALELRKAADGLRAVADYSEAGARLAGLLAGHDFQAAGGPVKVARELYLRIEGIETEELLLPGVAPRAESPLKARRLRRLPIASPGPIAEPRLHRAVVNLEALHADTKKVEPPYYDVGAILAAAAFIDGETAEETARLYGDAKRMLPDSPHTAALLAFGSIVSGFPMWKMKAYYDTALRGRREDDPAAAYLAIGAAVARVPVEDMVVLFNQASHIADGKRAAAAILAMAHVVTGKSFDDLREFYYDYNPDLSGTPKAAWLAMATALGKSEETVQSLYRSVGGILPNHPYETSLFTVALIWQEGLVNP